MHHAGGLFELSASATISYRVAPVLLQVAAADVVGAAAGAGAAGAAVVLVVRLDDLSEAVDNSSLLGGVCGCGCYSS